MRFEILDKKVPIDFIEHFYFRKIATSYSINAVIAITTLLKLQPVNVGII